MEKKSAVEWLKTEIEKYGDPEYLIIRWTDFDELINQTKEMEKEQIMKSFKSARIPYKYDADLTLNGFEDAGQYYNETYEKANGG